METKPAPLKVPLSFFKISKTADKNREPVLSDPANSRPHEPDKPSINRTQTAYILTNLPIHFQIIKYWSNHQLI